MASLTRKDPSTLIEPESKHLLPDTLKFRAIKLPSMFTKLPNDPEPIWETEVPQ